MTLQRAKVNNLTQYSVTPFSCLIVFMKLVQLQNNRVNSRVNTICNIGSEGEVSCLTEGKFFCLSSNTMFIVCKCLHSRKNRMQMLFLTLELLFDIY